MEEAEVDESVIRRAAARGARTVTTRRQVVDDAILHALERWEDALLAQKGVTYWDRWAFRIGANAARRLASGAQRARSQPTGKALAAPAVPSEQAAQAEGETCSRRPPCSATLRRLLRANLTTRRKFLRGRQLEVLMKLATPGMTFHRAAKELGMHRFSVRRSFQSAVKQLGRR